MRTKIAVALAVLALAGMAAYAQSAPIRADVPFDFIALDKTMKAGTYSVEHMDVHPAVLLIRGVDHKGALFANTVLSEGVKGQTTVARLVFNRYGDTYFLSQIWFGGNIANQLPKSHREAEMAKIWTPTEVALVINK